MNMLMQNTCHQPFFNLAEISANFKCQIQIRSILTNFTKLFPGLLKKGNACEKKIISFLQKVLKWILKVNLSSHHMLSISWENKHVSLQTQTCWGQHTETSLGEDMDIVFLAFKSNLTFHSLAFKILFNSICCTTMKFLRR